MRQRPVILLLTCLIGLCLGACDAGIAIPGVHERPGTQPETPPADAPPERPVLPSDPTPLPPPETEQPTETSTPTDNAPEDVEIIPAPEQEPEFEPDTESVTETETEVEQPTKPTEEETPSPEAPLVPLPIPFEPAFSYHAPGHLTPGSGQGAADLTIYAPNMVFPVRQARAFPQSMVFQPGGFRYSGDLPGDECIPENYEYPWRDNFCERGRPASFKSASCPSGSGVHLGQDIRVGDGPTCQSMRQRYRTNTQSITDYKVVAAEDGIISNISSYTVTLRAGPRTYRYLHMNMRALQVSIGDSVTAGEHLGYVSKDFGFDGNGKRRPTTFHLHFVLKINTDEGAVFVPPYTSLVAAYARREGAPGKQLERNIAIASGALSYDPSEVFDLTE